MQHMQHMQREKYEWAQLWWDNADDNKIKRILLVGDSISVGYREGVQKLFGDTYAIDLLATSKGINDPGFIKELEYMLSQYDYEVVHFNNGIHGLYMDIDTYELSYRYVLNFIKTKCENIVLVLSTPATEEHEPTKHSADNDIITVRNKVVLKIAKEYNFPINDLYSAMDGKPKYKVDCYHYNQEGKGEQSGIVKSALEKVLK